MAIILDHQLREYIPHSKTDFPITYFHDELATLPDWAGPLHWHPDFEIATAEIGTLDYQVGKEHIILNGGDSIFVNKNMLHGIRQISGSSPDPMPNIVFSGAVIAPEASTVYQKHILPIASCDFLPFIVFRQNEPYHREINELIADIYSQMEKKELCYELALQRDLSRIFQFIILNFNELPKADASRIQISNQIRLQKMLNYIYESYSKAVSLADIAGAAGISRSEAGRCFQAYMGCSPIEALIRYRLQQAHMLLSDNTMTLQEISYACGFNSVNYFSRQFKKRYGYSPGLAGNMGK